MNTLTNKNCTEWLADRKIAADPYHAPGSGHQNYKQLSLTENNPCVSAIFRSVVSCAEPFKAALLHITDWSLYSPDEMAVVVHLRQAFGERFCLIDTPGHVFSADERDLLIGLCALITTYGWTAYLYFDHGLTLLSWEGDILDLWSSDTESYNSICEVLQSMDVLTLPAGTA